MSDKLNAFFKAEHSRLMTDVFLLLNAGKMPSAQQIKDLGDFTGNVNYWPDHQAEFVPVGYKRDGANFVPDQPAPPVADVLAAFDARAAVGQNCAFYSGLWDPLCFGPLQDRLVKQHGMDPNAAATRINQQLNAYNANGSLKESPDAASPSGYSFQSVEGGTAHAVHDVNGAADAYFATTHTNVPPPLT